MRFFTIIPSNTNFDFIGKFKPFLIGSAALVAFIVYEIATKGFNYGIDFTGGTVFLVKFDSAQSADAVRKRLLDVGTPDASAVAVGTTQTEYLVTSRTESTDPLHKRFIAKGGAELLQVDVVGPKVGRELRKSALLSLVYSVLLIMVYIWFRFDAKFAPGATIAMIHDVILAAGYYLLTGQQFTITSIAALLTIAGYSVNDTIVIYDRVRELMKQGGQDLPLGPTINKAINLTLSRTILTSLLTLLSLIPIAVLCTGEIQSFAMAMMVGLFVGIYSTIYIAAPFTIYAAKHLGKAPSKGRVVTA